MLMRYSCLPQVACRLLQLCGQQYACGTTTTRRNSAANYRCSLCVLVAAAAALLAPLSLSAVVALPAIETA
eukprot:9152-Heterococcus_DN1.PRE.2